MAEERLVLSDASPLIGLAAAARPYLAHLAKHGFYFSQDLARELLRSVGEE